MARQSRTVDIRPFVRVEAASNRSSSSVFRKPPGPVSESVAAGFFRRFGDDTALDADRKRERHVDARDSLRIEISVPLAGVLLQTIDLRACGNLAGEVVVGT